MKPFIGKVSNLGLWDVYLVTDRALSMGRSNYEVARAAIRGGVSVIQLREKLSSTVDFYKQGLEIADLLRSESVPLLINDRLDIALALNADGVHLGRSDMPAPIARNILGEEKILGLSINYEQDMDSPDIEMADYLAVSPVFHTATKEDITEPWGLEGVRKLRAMTDLPLVGIGGIDQNNAREVARAGIDCVAVVSAIVSAEDPEAATRELVEQVKRGKEDRLTGDPH